MCNLVGEFSNVFFIFPSETKMLSVRIMEPRGFTRKDILHTGILTNLTYRFAVPA